MQKSTGESALDVYIRLRTKAIPLVRRIANQHSDIDLDKTVKIIAKTGAGYFEALAYDRIPNRKAEYALLLDIACKARDIAKAIESVPPNIREFFLEEIEKTDSDQYVYWEHSRTWKWLKKQSDLVPMLSEWFEVVPSVPGKRPLEEDWATFRLISGCKRVVLEIPITNEEEQQRLVRMIAREIHFLVTGQRQPQKFRKIQIEFDKSI